jgi:rhodanese-related sulfurtransferase
MAMKHSPQFLKLATEAQSRVQRCSVADVKNWISEEADMKLIDVREESEFAAGHLPNAIAMGRGVIERDIENRIPDPATKIVLYCGGGYRSALAAESLQKMGYTNVISMDGGWSGWKEAGLPTE